jgi:hypothetical protein
MIRPKLSSCVPPIFAVATLLNLAPLAHSQDAAGAKQQKIAALKESLAKNKAALKQYTWVEMTQISMKGEIKKTEQKQCQYGPDGTVQKTDIPGAAPAQQQESGGGRRRRGGAIKKEIVEKKVGELKDYMGRVKALIQNYVPPDPQKIQAAVAAGNLSVQPNAGVTKITIKDYLKQSDSLAIGFDSAAKKMASYNVNSYLDNPKDDPVTLAVTFASLPDGTSYTQRTVLDAAAKNIQVTVTNSDYRKLGQ